MAIFTDIIKIITLFIKTIFRDPQKVKRIKNYLPKSNLYLDTAKFVDFQWKDADISRTQRMCNVIQIFFGSSLGKV